MCRGSAAPHAILHTADVAADRAFLRDVLGLEHVASGGGRLIVQLPPAEVAVHPAETSGAVELYPVCDDVDETVADLGARGLEVERPVSDQGGGRRRRSGCPGGGRRDVYEAHHPTAVDL